jgi:hypothetical protein
MMPIHMKDKSRDRREFHLMDMLVMHLLIPRETALFLEARRTGPTKMLFEYD